MDIVDNRLRVGMRVAVAETEAKYLEKLHIFNNVAWNPKKMPQVIFFCLQKFIS